MQPVRAALLSSRIFWAITLVFCALEAAILATALDYSTEEDRLATQLAVTHQASGVAGLQSAIAAGLGVACINAAVLTEAMAPVLPGAGLPHLSRVRFGLLPVQGAEPALVQQVRALLQSDWVA